VTDYPAACFSEELVAAYPDAKVILTVRDNVEVWHRSVTETLWTGKPFFGTPGSLGQSILQAIIPKPGMLYKHTFLNNHPEEGRKGYLEHNEMVRRLAKENGREFLEFNVKEGWGPLCQFLGVEEPEEPFPRVNDTKTWQEFVAKTKKEAAARMLGNLGKVVATVRMVGLGVWMAMKKT